MRIDLGGFAAFDQPDNERTEDVPDEMKKQSKQCAGMTEYNPRPRIGRRNWADRRRRFHALFFHTFDVRAKSTELFVKMFVTAIDVINPPNLRCAFRLQTRQHQRG